MCTERRQVSGTAGQLPGGEAERPFDAARVNEALAGSMFHGKLLHFRRIDSTQTRAVADAQAGADGGRVYVTDEQTAGRGRGGNIWHSEPGSGLYLTVLVRPSLRAEDALLLSLAAGLAAQAAVMDVTGLRIDLRWPNDLMSPGPGSLKLGGILIESGTQPDGKLRYAAMGIGINLNQSAMPDALQDVSTSVRMLTGAVTPREELLSALLRRLEAELILLPGKRDTLLARIAESSTWIRGKRVSVAEGEGYTGVTNGLLETGLLRVRCDDGSERVVRHGGVRELT